MTEGRKSMKPVTVRNVKIGKGMPKICVPIVGVTKEEIYEEAKNRKCKYFRINRPDRQMPVRSTQLQTELRNKNTPVINRKPV